jgi:hypothetical protein
MAGWQVMIMAATHPDVGGPIMPAGSPLSCRVGVRGKNRRAISTGRSAAPSGDFGGGIFDGAHLVANFEELDAAYI